MRFAALPLALLAALTASAENWPQWRGPTGDGVSRETGVATSWSPTRNVVWMAPLEGWGTSTPIVWGDRIFLPTQVGDGPLTDGANDFEGARDAKKMDVDGVRFVVKAFHRKDGKLLWEKGFEAGDSLPGVHRKHNLASPSCVTDGERVYAWFGTGLIVALTLDGDIEWERNLAQDNAAFDVRWGHGSSPTLYGDSLLLLVDHPEHAYLLAADKATGKDRWKRDRGGDKRSYTTPFLVPGKDGDLLMINTSVSLEAVDPNTGETVWEVDEPNRVPVATPVYHEGVVYTNRGYNSSPYLATRVDGDEPRVLWRVGTGGPYVSSVVHADGVLFMATESGIAGAVDAETGKSLWKKRLGGVFSASPIVVDGKIYFTDEDGKTTIVEAGREFKVVAENDLGERTLASPAVSGGTLFIRTDDHLYAIGKS